MQFELIFYSQIISDKISENNDPQMWKVDSSQKKRNGTSSAKLK